MSQEFYIYGRVPIQELITEKPDIIKRLYIKENMTGDFFSTLTTYAKQKRIPLHIVTEKKLKDLVGDVNTQNVVAEISDFSYSDFHTWLDQVKKIHNPCVIVLDEVQDPHNVGAIIRSAAGLGAQGIILSDRRQAGVTGTVFKTSAGAAIKIPIIQAGNINQIIERLKENGFWVAGLAGEGSSSLYDFVFDSPIALVIGNEGDGIREKTKEHCDHLIHIPLQHNVESLNASVATAIALYERARQNSSQ